jgi:glycosyltransferase involved in cell wall biosynthesis
VILDKATVVYPAIRQVPDNLLSRPSNRIRLLFSGDFFRKGGVNVIDVFERLQRSYPNLNLRVCCSETTDFNTTNDALKNEYLHRIKTNAAIEFGRVSREKMLNEVLPQTDVYLLPTYHEAFGFAILEAMAYGIPVVATNCFAIPEIIAHEHDGFLIDISQFDVKKLFPGYRVAQIPTAFRESVNEQLYCYLEKLIRSDDVRCGIRKNSVATARTKFSFATRNWAVQSIYAN